MDDGPVKPDPFPVRLAMETLGASAAWMVGDTPDDIVSARANGVVPIGIIPPGADRESTATALRNAGAVTTIDHLHPLLEWLP